MRRRIGEREMVELNIALYRDRRCGGGRRFLRRDNGIRLRARAADGWSACR
jgi:hypothetical protein